VTSRRPISFWRHKLCHAPDAIADVPRGGLRDRLARVCHHGVCPFGALAIAGFYKLKLRLKTDSFEQRSHQTWPRRCQSMHAPPAIVRARPCAQASAGTPVEDGPAARPSPACSMSLTARLRMQATGSRCDDAQRGQPETRGGRQGLGPGIPGLLLHAGNSLWCASTTASSRSPRRRNVSEDGFGTQP
jgi:hypothetical protein